MIYLCKASAILAMFYLIYIICLQKETYVVANRVFLLSGLVATVILPLIVLPNYVDVAPIEIGFEQVVPNKNELEIAEGSNIPTAAEPILKPFGFMALLPIIYVLGVAILFFKLIFSFVYLKSILSQAEKSTRKGNVYYFTQSEIAPFSFFNRIVFNPSQFNATELRCIIRHELVHARQYHSVDVIMAQLVAILLWFNPFVWLYKKALQQNLEFIADREAEHSIGNKKEYQRLLLKTSIPSHQFKLVNNFYTSLIKKRIVMLQKSKSSAFRKVKLLAIFPLLAVFLMSFNRETIYVPLLDNSLSFSDEYSQPNKDVEVLFDKDMTNKNLEQIKMMLLEQGIEFEYSRIKRNKNGKIIKLKFEFKKNGKTTNYNLNGDDPIKPFYFKMNKDSFGISTVEHSKSKKIQNKSKIGKNTQVVLNNEEDDFNKDKPSENEKEYVTKQHKTYSHSITNDDETDIVAIQNDGFESINTDDGSPLVILNGKETDYSVISLLSPNKIESLTVLKHKNATEIFGEKGKYGVLIIVTKDSRFDENRFPNAEDISVYTDLNGRVRVSGKNADNVIYIYNDKILTKNELDKLDKNNIKSVMVLENAEAVEKYGARASGGVVVIHSKKKNTSVSQNAQNNATSEDNKNGHWGISLDSEPANNSRRENSASIEFMINSDVSDAFIERQIRAMSGKGIIAKIKRIRRNKSGEITGLKITLSDDNGQKASASWKSNDEVIPDIVMGKSKDGNLMLRALN